LQSEDSFAQRFVASGITPVYSPATGHGDSCKRSNPVKMKFTVFRKHFFKTITIISVG
jgi:hypothetical protein